MIDEPPSRVLSWRDPDGFVLNFDGRILRAVAVDKAAGIRAVIASAWMDRFLGEGSISLTRELPAPPDELAKFGEWVWFEHGVVPFPCYPHEITASQLHDSALLTLAVAIAAAEHGWLLKDASAWNVLHSEGRPVFVDLLSFERHDSTAAWPAYGQFVRHFVLPLLLFRARGMTPAEIFLIHRDGITPEHAYGLLRGPRMVSPNGLEFILLPKWLANAGRRAVANRAGHKVLAVHGQARTQLLLNTLHRLRRKIVALRPAGSAIASVWGSYEEERLHYSPEDLEAKKEFVRRHLVQGRRVLDLGCNAGEFSLLAAEYGNSVVAADFDHSALSRLYARLRARKLPVEPLLLNVGRPTPAVGWRNSEVASLLDRAARRFDCVLMLGLIHHLLVSERASLTMIVELLDHLAPPQVILEWIDPTDPKFRQLSGLNSALYAGLNAHSLEAEMGRKFRLDAKLGLPCKTRVMYLWARK